MSSELDLSLYIILQLILFYSAETTAGGFALWTTTGAYGSLRNADPRYEAAWEPFITASNAISAKHQFANGGSLVSLLALLIFTRIEHFVRFYNKLKTKLVVKGSPMARSIMMLLTIWSLSNGTRERTALPVL